MYICNGCARLHNHVENALFIGLFFVRGDFSMKTVIEYAQSVGKTHQAVYKQLKAKKNKPKLEGHVWQQNGTTYLDDVAIEILNESRKVTQVKQNQQLKSENERMIKEIDDLKNKIISLQDELKVKTEQMATMLVENKEKTLLLEQKKDQSNQIEELKKDKQVLQNEKEEQKQQIEELQQEKKELQEEMNQLKATNDQLSAKVASQSVSEGQKEPKKGFFARLFGK